MSKEGQGFCLMAQSDDDEEEVCDPKYVKLFASKSREQIAMLVKNLSIEIRTLTKEVAEKDELISNLTEEIAEWAKKYKKLDAKSINNESGCLLCPVLKETVEVLETKGIDLRKNNARIISELKAKVVNEKELKKIWTKELELKKLSDMKKVMLLSLFLLNPA